MSNSAQKQQPVYNIYNLGEMPPELKASVSTSNHNTAQRLLSQNLHDLRAYAQLKYPVKISSSQKNSQDGHRKFYRAKYASNAYNTNMVSYIGSRTIANNAGMTY